MKRFRQRKAFTIVEMVIVIAVIAILATVLVPTISGVIQKANHSADQQFAASLNVQLAMYSVDNPIESESDLRDAINSYYGKFNDDGTLADDGDFYATLAPKSAQQGYHYWYDYTNGIVFVETVQDAPKRLAEHKGETISAAESPTQQADEMKPTLMFLSSRTDKSEPISAVALASGGRQSFADNARASLRIDLVEGAYLMGNKVEEDDPSDILGLITKFENMTDAGDYEDTVKFMYELQEALETDDPNNNKTAVDALVIKAEKTAIFNGRDFFLPYNENAEGVDGEGYEIWTPVTVAISVEEAVLNPEVKVYEYKDEAVSDTSRGEPFPVKGGEFQVHGNINTLKALSGLMKMPGSETGKVTMYLDVTLEELKGMSMPDDTDYVIALPDGNKYRIEGTDVVNIDTGVKESLDQSKIEEVLKDYTIEVEYNNSGNPGDDQDYFHDGTLYLAWDFDSVEIPLANNTPASLVEWTVSENALIKIDKGVISLIEGAKPDSQNATATVTATLKGDATKTDSITVQLVFPLEVEWTIDNAITKNDTKVDLNYTGSTDFGITVGEDDVVYVANADYYVKLNDEPTVSFTAGEGNLFSVVDNNKLVLVPANIEDNDQTLTVTYGDYVTQTYTVTAKDNSSVGLKKNEITTGITMGETYLFRVGNSNSFTLGKLFSAVEAGKAVDVQAVNIYDASKSTGTNGRVVIATSGTGFTATYTANSNWADATVKFSGTGVAIIEVVTAKGATELAVEVVDGKNVTAAGDFTGATNYVVLNDIAWGSTTSNTAVSGTIYGNGFAINAQSATNSAASNNALFYLNGGIIDNLVINGPVYPELIYQSAASASKPYYVAGIYATGDAKITNSKISGFREPVMANGSSMYLENTTLIGGNYANLWLQSGSLTLNNVTTAQQPTTTTIGSGTVLGAGIIANSGVNASNVTIIGNLNQYNWVTKDQVSDHMDSDVSSLIDEFFNNTTITHTVNGTKYINTGIVFQSTTGTVNNASQTAGHGYTTETVSGSLMGVSFTGNVYTRTTTSGAVTSIPTYGGYTPNTQSVIKPAFKHNLTLTNGEVRYSIDIPKGETAKLIASGYTVSKYSGQNIAVNITCPGATVDSTKKEVTFSKVGTYTLTYTVEDNTFYNADGSKQTKNNVDIYTVTVVVSNSNHPNAVINVGNHKTDMNTYTKWVETGNVADKDYQGWYEVLNGITITDYNEDGTSFTVTPTSTDLKGLSIKASDSQITGVSTDGGYWMYDKTDDDGNTATYNITFTYTYTGKNGNTVTASTKHTLTGGTDDDGKVDICVTPDTLVTLADGTQKMIKDVKLGESVVAWNFYTGAYESVPVSLIQAHNTGYLDVLKLYFEDGTALNVLGEHGIYDADLNTFIFIDQYDVDDYVGHNFVKQSGEGFATTKLVGYEVVNEYTTAYTILSYAHYNVMLEGMFTVTPAHVGGNFFNPFEVNADMKYDEAQMQADIEKYGLYTYEDFADYVTNDQFEALKLSHFKISVGKGLVTYDGLVYLLQNFVNNEDFNVNN